MKAYSDDLRSRIIKAYFHRGDSIGKIAKQFFVSKTFVFELIILYRNTGGITPRSKINNYPVPVD
jgi:transposase